MKVKAKLVADPAADPATRGRHRVGAATGSSRPIMT
jgi:hypothetical protein